MLGDDVVDLSDPEASEAALHPRFDARAFAPCERARLDAAPAAQRSRLRWSLWAAKEAAYKAARQIDPAARFHPRAFVVAGDGVTHAGRRFAVRIHQADGALHALAAPEGEDLGATLSGVAVLAPREEAGALARALALRAAARALGIPAEELSIARGDGRVPRLWLRGSPLPAALSLSHHGRFAAFALRLPCGARAEGAA